METPTAAFWKRKLAAFLHDPPEKAFDYGPHHVERARIYAQNLGLDLDEWLRGNDKADWSAAAADRFLFPSSVPLGGEPAFQHPLSPSGAGPLLTRTDFPDQTTTEEIVSNVLPTLNAGGEETFLRVWRRWLQSVVENGAEKRGAEWIGLLPADTRIPDATIWHHTAITSAVEATRGDDGQLHPAFLLVQV
ncbi:MAG: hypothetical protein HY736_05570, partial [Verrucomicrobia bacterium]|nr:hypothetical protein [Verrucomicrobiota bacterium]